MEFPGIDRGCWVLCAKFRKTTYKGLGVIALFKYFETIGNLWGDIYFLLNRNFYHTNVDTPKLMHELHGSCSGTTLVSTQQLSIKVWPIKQFFFQKLSSLYVSGLGCLPCACVHFILIDLSIIISVDTVVLIIIISMQKLLKLFTASHITILRLFPIIAFIILECQRRRLQGIQRNVHTSFIVMRVHQQ